MALSLEQQSVLDRVQQAPHEHLFITGGAGTGKSYVLGRIIEHLGETQPLGSVAVTASTGVAAGKLRGGCTFHSWSGMGLAQGSVEQILRAPALQRKGRAYARVRRARVLVSDELSMLPATVLDKFDGVARAVRERPTEPFGGIRLIGCGDPLQLPAIGDEMAHKGEAPFFFESAVWAQAAPHFCELTQQHRQVDDVAYTTLLNEVRMGVCSAATEAILKSRLISVLPPLAKDAICTRMFPHNATVDAHNAGQLAKLPGEAIVYEAEDQIFMSPDGEQALKQMLVAPVVKLKLHCQVMLLVNSDVPGGLYNGAQGIVTDFVTPAAILSVEEDVQEGTVKPVAKRPPPMPVVRFENGRTVTVGQVLLKHERDRMLTATRFQVPLRLSYASSIHKTQGLTITSAAEIDAGESNFAPGQVYVALSRLQRLDQLRLRDFSPRAIRAHPRAVAWIQDQQQQKRGVKRAASEVAPDAPPEKKLHVEDLDPH